jgi:hypothetical protein
MPAPSEKQVSLAAMVDRDDLAPNFCMAGEREDRQRPTLTAGQRGPGARLCI